MNEQYLLVIRQAQEPVHPLLGGGEDALKPFATVRILHRSQACAIEVNEVVANLFDHRQG
jgi:hypothetical protein